MKKLMILAVLVGLVALCATTALAGVPFDAVKKVSAGSADYFPSADKNKNIWLTKSQSLYKITSSGNTIYEGNVNGGCDSPVWYKNGLAMYDTGSGGNKPMVWDWSDGTFNYPVSDWTSRPWIAPRVSDNGQNLVFATGKNEIAVFDGTSTTRWSQWDTTKYQLASIDWLNNDTLIVTVQDKYDAILWGYHLVTVNLATHQVNDYGKGFSQVAVAGSEIMLTAWNHQTLGRFRMDGEVLRFTENIYADGVNYWNLGGGAITKSGPLFAALDGQNNVWAIGNPDAIIPEPGSLIALLSGLIGLGGLMMRRR